YQCVRVDHGSFANIRSHVNEHRRHTNDAAPNVASVANAGTARHDAHSVGGSDGTRWISGLVDERLARSIDGHINDDCHPKAEQNSFFHPRIRAPAAVHAAIRFGSANLSTI